MYCGRRQKLKSWGTQAESSIKDTISRHLLPKPYSRPSVWGVVIDRSVRGGALNVRQQPAMRPGRTDHHDDTLELRAQSGTRTYLAHSPALGQLRSSGGKHGKICEMHLIFCVAASPYQQISKELINSDPPLVLAFSLLAFVSGLLFLPTLIELEAKLASGTRDYPNSPRRGASLGKSRSRSA